MSNHTEVGLEIAGAVVLTYALSFIVLYICLSRFIQDATP